MTVSELSPDEAATDLFEALGQTDLLFKVNEANLWAYWIADTQQVIWTKQDAHKHPEGVVESMGMSSAFLTWLLDTSNATNHGPAKIHAVNQLTAHSHAAITKMKGDPHSGEEPAVEELIDDDVTVAVDPLGKLSPPGIIATNPLFDNKPFTVTATATTAPDPDDQDPQPLADKAGKEFDAMVEVFPKNQMDSAPTVKLRDATKLYQPVQGTSGGSRYFALGISEGLNLALRWKDITMAIRIEGTALSDPEVRGLAEAIGFSGTTAVYGSMHVKVPNLISARKVIGGIMLAFRSRWDSQLPDVKVVQGIGS